MRPTSLSDSLKETPRATEISGLSNRDGTVSNDMSTSSDQQTNLAQTHSHLNYSRMERLPPRRDGQLVSYPATAWFKKKRQYLMNDRYSSNPLRFLAPRYSMRPQSVVSDTLTYEFFDWLAPRIPPHTLHEQNLTCLSVCVSIR